MNYSDSSALADTGTLSGFRRMALGATQYRLRPPSRISSYLRHPKHPRIPLAGLGRDGGVV